MGLQALIDIINDPAARAACWHDGREAKKALFPEGHSEHNYKNACASVAHTYAMKAGIVPVRKVIPLCSLLAEHFLSLGWTRIESWRDLEPGDFAFALDWGGAKGPDHVSIIYRHASDRKSAMVVDNYMQDPHERNLASGSKTPHWFALRPPK